MEKQEKYLYGGPLIRRGYPLLDDPPARRSGEEEMAKSAPHPWEKVRPSPLKGAFKKAFYAIFIICAVQTPRTPHEQ